MAVNASVGRAVLEIATDSGTYDASIVKAKKDAKELGQTWQQTTTQLRGMQSSLQAHAARIANLTRDLSGDRVLAQANAMVRAVQNVGGATRLTESEQRRVNATVTEAIAKYRALGQTAPAAMVAIQRETAAAGNQVGTLTSLATRFGPALAATFSAGAVLRFGRSIGEFASRMQDLSAETQIGVERLQALNYIGAGAGLTIEDLTAAVDQLVRRVGSGDTSAVRTLERLGLRVDDLRRMRPDEIFIAVSEAAARIEDPVQRNVALFELFGRTGSRAARIISTDLGDTVREVEKSGAVIQKELIERAAKFDDAWEQALIRLKAEAFSTVTSVATALTHVPARPGLFAEGKVGGGGPTPAEQLAAVQAQLDEARKKLTVPRAELFAPGTLATARIGITATDAEIKALERRSTALAESAAAQIEFDQAVKRLSANLSGGDVLTAAKQYETALQRIGGPTRLTRQESETLVQAFDAVIAKYRVLGTAGAPVVSHFEGLAATVRPLLETIRPLPGWYTTLASRIDLTRASLEAYAVIAHNSVVLAGEHAAAVREENLELARRGHLLDFSAHRSGNASQEAAAIRTQQIQDRIAERQRATTEFWRRQLAYVAEIRSATVGSLATILLGDRGGDTREARAEVERLKTAYERLKTSGTASAEALTRAFQQWQDAVDQQNRTFVSRWEAVWFNVKRIALRSLDEILAHYTTRFLSGLLRGIAGSRLAQLGQRAGESLPGWWDWIPGLGSFGGGPEKPKPETKAQPQDVGTETADPVLAGTTRPPTPGPGRPTTPAPTQARPPALDFTGSLSQRMTATQVASFARGGFVPPHAVVPAVLHGGSRGELVTPIDRLHQAAAGLSAEALTRHRLAAGNWMARLEQRGGIRIPEIRVPDALQTNRRGQLAAPLTTPQPQSQPPLNYKGVNLNVTIQALDGRSVRDVFVREIVPWLRQELIIDQYGLGTAAAGAVHMRR